MVYHPNMGIYLGVQNKLIRINEGDFSLNISTN